MAPQESPGPFFKSLKQVKIPPPFSPQCSEAYPLPYFPHPGGEGYCLGGEGSTGATSAHPTQAAQGLGSTVDEDSGNRVVGE